MNKKNNIEEAISNRNPLAKPASPKPVVPVDLYASQDRDDDSKVPEQKTRPIFLTPVIKSKLKVLTGLYLFPTRNEQLKDLSYIEGRPMNAIAEQAFEEYVIKYYGEQYRRKD